MHSSLLFKDFFDLFLIPERFISSLKAPEQQSVLLNCQSKQTNLGVLFLTCQNLSLKTGEMF